MMLKEYFVLFLLGHVLGDFYFQTKTMALKKEKSIKRVLIHGLVYALTMLVVCIPVINVEIAIAVVLASVFHLVVDLLKYQSRVSVEKKGYWTSNADRKAFYIDQILHVIGLIFISYLMATRGPLGLSWQPFHDAIHYLGIPEVFLRSAVLALLLIHKPANIIIQKLLTPYKPENSEEDGSNNAGRFIGTVERIIMFIFLYIGQYAAIGLVLTAKSIARYDRISKEKDFAEYYLLGTLMSTLLVLVFWLAL